MRNPFSYLFLVTCIGLGGACGTASMGTSSDGSIDGGSEAVPEALCDGTAEVKLRVFIQSQNERESRGSVVRVENGFPSFMVDGKCNYWMGGEWYDPKDPDGDPNGRNLGWRQGKLAPDMSRELEQALPLAGLAALEDCDLSMVVSDAPTTVIVSKKSFARCLVGGPKFTAAWNAIVSRAPELWSLGTPMMGGMWISAATESDGSPFPAYPWPLDDDMSLYLLDETPPGGEGEYAELAFGSGHGHLISDPTATQKLRALRQQYLEDTKVSISGPDAPKVSDGTTDARLYTRDALPYEDARGLLPFQSPP